MSPARLALPLALLLAAPLARADWSQGFAAGTQGWTVQSGGALLWKDSGGNPGGFLELTDTTVEDFDLVAPQALLGNWTGYLGGTFSFDAINLNGDSADWAPFGTLVLSGPGGSVEFDMVPGAAPAPGAGWTSFSVQLSAANFGPQLGAVLANVTSLRLRGEFHAGVSEVIGIDNVRLISAVPEPGSAALLLAGLGLIGLGRRKLPR